MFWNMITKRSNHSMQHVKYVVTESDRWLLFLSQQIAVYSMYVAVMAFFARVSDPAVGGTYMTLLNTLSNLGGNWPSTLALWMVDSLTYKQCSAPSLQNNTCITAKDTEVFCEIIDHAAMSLKIEDFWNMVLCYCVSGSWHLKESYCLFHWLKFKSFCTAWSWRSRYYTSSECQELFAQWHGVTSQEACVCTVNLFETLHT
jgi:hypothetical protein